MTRINVIPSDLLMDQHLQAACNEGIRPYNDIVKRNWVNVAKAPTRFKLGEGHVLWARKYMRFTLDQLYDAQHAWELRGFKPYVFDVDESLVPENLLKPYTPTKEDYRVNLDRLIERWHARKKPYTFYGEPVDTVEDLNMWVEFVEDELDL